MQHIVLSKTIHDDGTRVSAAGTAILQTPDLRFPLSCGCLFTHLVPDEPAALDELGHFICGVAGEQEPVPRLHLVGKSHEGQGVTAEGERHPPADDLGGLLHVVDGGDGKTPVGNRAPEVRTHEVVAEVLAPDIVRRLSHQRTRHGRAGHSATLGAAANAPWSPMTPVGADSADTEPSS
uniref:Mitochondrial pyruvate carrier 1 isoform X1 n=1 Tax=Sus scrofa TaxID=9823 RepID=A0A480GH10_PIG